MIHTIVNSFNFIRKSIHFSGQNGTQTIAVQALLFIIQHRLTGEKI